MQVHRKHVFAAALLYFILGFAFVPHLLTPKAEAKDSSKTITLPAPQKTGGKPLMETLSLRKSERAISDKALSGQELSNLLWATWGVNRDDGKHTAPTANNKQQVQLYAVLESGVWLYNADKNELILAVNGDMRSKYGPAAVTLLYAAPEGDRYSGMHVGSLYQNAGLFCASAGLANVVQGSGRDALKGTLKLPDGYEILIIQSVGYKK